LYKADPELAILFYLLFKKNVQGENPEEFEVKRTVQLLQCESSIFSNISKKIFEHPDFLPYKKKTVG